MAILSKQCGRGNSAHGSMSPKLLLLAGLVLLVVVVVIGIVNYQSSNAPLTPEEHQWLVAMSDHLAVSDQVVNQALKSLSSYLGSIATNQATPESRAQLDTQLADLRAWTEQGKTLVTPPRFRGIGREYSGAMDEINYFFDKTPQGAADADVAKMTDCIAHLGNGGKCFKRVRANVQRLLETCQSAQPAAGDKESTP